MVCGMGMVIMPMKDQETGSRIWQGKPLDQEDINLRFVKEESGVWGWGGLARESLRL